MKTILKILIILVPAVIIVGLAGYGATRAAKRLWTKIPFVQANNWERRFSDLNHEISIQLWQDQRPLIVLAGDSHIEFGKWYQWFQGALAVRNCGMATARIKDVARLISSLREPRIDTLLLHCGINNLGGGDPPAMCMDQYLRLLEQAAALNPQHIVVIAVMPVRQSPLDTRNRELNAKVREFNALLREHCKTRAITYIDLVDIVADSAGGLKDAYSDDGLHLNAQGYATITPELRRALRAP